MRASKWQSPSGKVHWRRLRFWIATPYETAASKSIVTTLCGSRSRLTQVPMGSEVDCGVCLKAAGTGAHRAR